MTSLLRIVARSRIADSIGDPKDFLAEYRRILERLQLPERDVEDARRLLEGVVQELGSDVQGVTRPGFQEVVDLAYKAYAKVANGWGFLHDVGHKLFLSLLQTYELPPAVRKKVELASRAYLKKPRKPSIKKHGVDRYLEFLELYTKFMGVVTGHFEAAQEAIAKGRPHSEEGPTATRIRVGAFTLVNTGGFPAKVMDTISDIITKVERDAKAAGFGEVCYGDVQITNTIHGKGRAVAFYLLSNDELFVRANLRNDVDTRHSILHELGHRYQHKFMGGKKRNALILYQKIKGQEDQRMSKLRSTTKPIPGDMVTSKGKTYRVEGTQWSRGDVQVLLHYKDDPTQKARISLDGWAELKGGGDQRDRRDPEFEGFVTEYAKRGGPDENFAEMFGFYCTGELPPKQRAAFEELTR